MGGGIVQLEGKSKKRKIRGVALESWVEAVIASGIFFFFGVGKAWH